jgi:glycosyltransferase involved in cell wall biosynthesis
MKIAIIRGPYLNKIEMQNYEPLLDHCDLTAYHCIDTFKPAESLKDITIPRKKLRSLEGILGYWMSRVLRYPFGFIGYRHHMIGLEKELKSYDIAHTAETYHAFSYQCIKAKRRYGTKVAVTCWENIPFFNETPNLRGYVKANYIKKAVRTEADFFIAITERARVALIYEGVPEEKITVIPAGVDLERFRPRPKDKEILEKLGLAEEDFLVLFVGVLNIYKGVYELVYAAKRLILDKDLDFIKKQLKFVLVGSGEEEQKLKELVKKLGISEHFVFPGRQPYMQIQRFYNVADIFTLPSKPIARWQEQFGMVFAEAMASKLPIVSTLCGSIPEVLGDAAMLVQPADAYSLYQGLKRVIIDDKLRGELRLRARKRAEEHFNPQKIALRIKQEYEKLSP